MVVRVCIDMSTVSISCAFDAGNIEVTSLGSAAEPVLLKVRPDPLTELEKKSHMQWFYFRSMAFQPGTVRYEITNAGEVSFPEAWPGSQVCVSTDRKTWARVRRHADAPAHSQCMPMAPMCCPWHAAAQHSRKAKMHAPAAHGRFPGVS